MIELERYTAATKLGIEAVDAGTMGCIAADIIESARKWIDFGSGRGEFSLALIEKNSLLNIWNLEERPDYMEIADKARKSLPEEESIRIRNITGKIEKVTRGLYTSSGILQNSMDVASVHCYEPGKISERNIVNAINYCLKPGGHAIMTLDSELDTYKKFLKYLQNRFSKIIVGNHPTEYPKTSFIFALWHRHPKFPGTPPFICIKK
ncbi:hypothetical protein HY792_05355 [Candidatus Desantisbacteria bacterium]|nr:hypothetical protein [Candidatus Desantisbacteria bacterium]